MSEATAKPVIMVSSTVYGIEELLERIYATLTAFGYEVWMSHKGTLPVRSDRTAFENCLKAVERCDLFLGLVTSSYGSGQDGGEPSIAHQELRCAIALDKPRWLLTHDDVVFARRLLRDLGYGASEDRQKLKLKKGAKSIDDLRVIDMYEDAILQQQPFLAARKGNWVQGFRSDQDALLFAAAQFSRFQEVERFIGENFADPAKIKAEIDRRRGDPT